VFEGLSAADLNEIEHECRYRRFSAQEHIIDRGSPTTDVFFVVRGRVRTLAYSVGGREVAFDDLTEGDHFGAISAFDGMPRSAGAVAMEDSLIVALPARAFLDLVETRPAVAKQVMIGLAAMIRSRNERIMDLCTLAATDRVLAELLRHARDHRDGGKGACIRPIPIHGEMASRAGTTRETVARVLNDLARKGLIARRQGALVVNDLDALETMLIEVRG
jgi:CRP-like cAMP-binding protein